MVAPADDEEEELSAAGSAIVDVLRSGADVHTRAAALNAYLQRRGGWEYDRDEGWCYSQAYESLPIPHEEGDRYEWIVPYPPRVWLDVVHVYHASSDRLRVESLGVREKYARCDEHASTERTFLLDDLTEDDLNAALSAVETEFDDDTVMESLRCRLFGRCSAPPHIAVLQCDVGLDAKVAALDAYLRRRGGWEYYSYDGWCYARAYANAPIPLDDLGQYEWIMPTPPHVYIDGGRTLTDRPTNRLIIDTMGIANATGRCPEHVIASRTLPLDDLTEDALDAALSHVEIELDGEEILHLIRCRLTGRCREARESLAAAGRAAPI